MDADDSMAARSAAFAVCVLHGVADRTLPGQGGRRALALAETPEALRYGVAAGPAHQVHGLPADRVQQNGLIDREVRRGHPDRLTVRQGGATMFGRVVRGRTWVPRSTQSICWLPSRSSHSDV